MTDSRERRIEHLKDATGENTKSKAIDTAIEYYIEMRGETEAVPTGRLEELVERAEEQGSVTPQEIAEILDTDALPLKYEVARSIGRE
jgi:hypothetical protein